MTLTGREAKGGSQGAVSVGAFVWQAQQVTGIRLGPLQDGALSLAVKTRVARRDLLKELLHPNHQEREAPLSLRDKHEDLVSKCV